MIWTGLLTHSTFANDFQKAPAQAEKSRCLLDPILRLRLLDRLPLHVFRLVRTAVLQRDDVIHDVAGAGARCATSRWAWVFTLELPPGCSRSHDAAAGVALAGGTACGRTWAVLAASVGRGAKLADADA